MYHVLERHMLEDRIADVRVQHEVAEGSAAVLSLRGVPGLAARASCSLELVHAASEEVGELQVVLDEGMYRLQHLRALASHLEARVLQRRDLLVQTSRPVVKPALVGVQSGEVDVLCLALGVTLPLALLEADGEGDNCQCGEADGGSVHRVHRAAPRAAGEDQEVLTGRPRGSRAAAKHAAVLQKDNFAKHANNGFFNAKALDTSRRETLGDRLVSPTRF